MTYRCLAGLLLSILLLGGALAYAEDEAGAGQHNPLTEIEVEGGSAGDDTTESNSERGGSGNWLAWLVGLPLLAALILAVLLLTRRKREADRGDDEEHR